MDGSRIRRSGTPLILAIPPGSAPLGRLPNARSFVSVRTYTTPSASAGVGHQALAEVDWREHAQLVSGREEP
jgi:hypothetical protein